MSDRLSHYELIEEIGVGGMGTVHRARDSRDGSVVAIKVLHPHLSRDPEYVRRFEREVRVAQRIDSPRVVRVLDSGQDGGSHFLVMEYIAGKTLAKRIQEAGRLTIEETVAIARAVAEALAAAHTVGIVHRDISPQNIMLDDSGGVKVTDFGVARDLGATAMTATSMLLGKPQYIAPEVVTGKSPVDIRADIYALGVVMYQMLAGSLPFDAETPFAIMQKQVYEAPISIARKRVDAPPWLVTIIERCLAKKPEERYLTPDQIVVALSARHPGAPGSVRRARGSGRRLAAAIALGGIATALTSAVVMAALMSGDDTTVPVQSLLLIPTEDLELATSATTAPRPTEAPVQLTPEPPADPPALTDTSLPDRTDCAAIRASAEYRSTAERTWFIQNCPPAIVPTATPPGVPVTSPPPPLQTGGNIRESFDGGTNRFRTAAPADARFSVTNGQLFLQHSGMGYYAHVVLGTYTNVRAAVDVIWSGSGTSNDRGGGLGLACRRPGEGVSTDYRMEINPATSQFRLIKLKDAVSFTGIGLTTFIHWSSLPQKWDPSRSHRLELTCSGESIEARLDGAVLGSARDSELTTGQVTLFGQGIIEVAFDNVELTALP